MFLLGMIGSVACTVAFALGAPPLFTMTWALSRILQSGGWAGVVKVSSRWFSHHSYGSVMGVLCLSYLFGDFVSRLALGQLLSWGMGWRGLFLSAAGVLFVAYLANLLLLRESPTELGLPEPSAGLGNLYGEEGRGASSLGLRDLLAPVFGSGLFWMVCILSFGFTLLRETFNTWMPQYLTEVVAMSPGAAGKASSLFPLFGGFSVLAAGYCSDRLGRGGRAGIILVGLLLSIPALLALGRLHPGHSPVVPLALLGAVALLLMGPYSFLAGAIALDFGGKKGSATVSGWVDGIGYLGGILAGQGIGSVAEHSGWGAAFGLLALTAALSSLAAALYLYRQVRGAS
jgi:OPA family glycerol-3-phosphate transporter-like MFS transporter